MIIMSMRIKELIKALKNISNRCELGDDTTIAINHAAHDGDFIAVESANIVECKFGHVIILSAPDLESHENCAFIPQKE